MDKSRDAEGMCLECLQVSLEHKFKTSLKHLGVKREADILVAYTGGAGSSLMLKCLHKCLHGSRSRMKLRVSDMDLLVLALLLLVLILYFLF